LGVNGKQRVAGSPCLPVPPYPIQVLHAFHGSGPAFLRSARCVFAPASACHTLSER
jgi:hypothetical protein